MFADGYGGTAGYRGAIKYNHSSDYMHFNTAAAERMRITSTGDLGIGTSAPAGALDVRGVGLFGEQTSSIAGSSHLQIARANDPIMSFRHLNSASAGQMGYINYYFKNTGGTETISARMGAKHTTTHSSQPGAGLVFQTAPDGGSLTDRVIINEDGNVGVGTDSPASLLHVAGTVQVGVDDAGHDVTFYGATAGSYMLWDESADALLLTDSTPIQIGDAQDLTLYHDGTDSYLTNATGALKIATETSGIAVSIGHTTSETTVNDNLTVTGALSVGGNAYLGDSDYLMLGTSNDLQIVHSGSHGFIMNLTGTLNIGNQTSGGAISIGHATSEVTIGDNLTVTGTATLAGQVSIPDSTELRFGDSTDFAFQHNGSHNLIKSHTGNLKLINYQDDGDILFFSDDGTGGITTYMSLDGGITSILVYKDILMANDGTDGNIKLGASQDLILNHDGTDSKITNATGDLYISNYADDKDIIFQSDDGAGGIETYFYLDGSAAVEGGARSIIHLDNVKSKWGDSGDFILYHDGTDSYIKNNGGDVIIQNTANDKDIVLESDDGSGGTAAYLILDGSTGWTTVNTPMELVETYEPDDPPAGHAVIWLHEGGTIYAKITVEETTSLAVIAQAGEGGG
jgi:hypothetical protein